MVWVRLEDDWYDNPKFQRISVYAEALYIRCLTWCNRNLTDGVIPRVIAARYAPAEAPDPRALPGELVAVGLWDEMTAVMASAMASGLPDPAFSVHDYGKYQPTRAAVEEQRAVKSRAGKLGSARRWGRSEDSEPPPPMAAVMTDAEQLPSSCHDKTVTPDPYPLRTTTTVAKATVVKANPPSPVAGQAREVFEYWKARCRGGNPRVLFTNDRQKKVRARLKERCTVTDLKLAVDGAALAAYAEGGKVYDDLALICRSQEKVELFMQRAGARAGEPRAQLHRESRSARNAARILSAADDPPA